MKIKEQKLKVKFYQNDSGKEPVRDWLKNLQKDEMKIIGRDVMKVQYGWPIGMPVVKSLQGYKKLWEIRTNLKNGIISRIIFTVYDDLIVLLHGFIKKSKKPPKKDIDIAEKRKNMFLKISNDQKGETNE